MFGPRLDSSWVPGTNEMIGIISDASEFRATDAKWKQGLLQLGLFHTWSV